MLTYIQLIEKIITESSLSFKYGYRSWYNPATKEFIKVMGADTHAKMVKQHPELFGVDPSEVDGPHQTEDYLKKLAFELGWIRIAGHDRNNPTYYMIFEGDDFNELYKVVRMFFRDSNGSIENVSIKNDQLEYTLRGNKSVRNYVINKELPEPHRLAA